MKIVFLPPSQPYFRPGDHQPEVLGGLRADHQQDLAAALRPQCGLRDRQEARQAGGGEESLDLLP